MQSGVFRVAFLRPHASGLLCWDKATPDDVLKANDCPFAAREDEILLALGTREFPFFESFEHMRPKRDGPLAGLRLRPTNRVISIGALAHMQLAALEVHVIPTQAARLAGA